MTVKNALKWTALYRALAAASLLVGMVLVIAGVVVGSRGALVTLADDPTAIDAAVEAANPLFTVAFAVAGVIVWQFGKAFALFVTLPRASGWRAADGFDSERLKSEIVEAIDVRLAEMEEDVAQTRRSVRKLERDRNTATFDDDDHIESTAGSSAGTTNAEPSGASRADQFESTGFESATNATATTGSSADATDESRPGSERDADHGS
ncbi:hypothetical protein ACFQGT_04320 [Natrialbaceae archaeon GCM10025810]|uniref:hypothetical protein n=1 Tax=Halovalidus salilacus TaxID=3075124 RepID=UPI003619812E